MSKSKRKKSHSAPVTRSETANQADKRIQNEKKFNPLARNLLLIDLVLLAVLQLLSRGNLIPESVLSVGTIFGATLLFISLSIQFGSGNDNPNGRRL